MCQAPNLTRLDKMGRANACHDRYATLREGCFFTYSIGPQGRGTLEDFYQVVRYALRANPRDASRRRRSTWDSNRHFGPVGGQGTTGRHNQRHAHMRHIWGWHLLTPKEYDAWLNPCDSNST